MLDDDFPASFALALAAKDARLAAEAAEGHGADLPMLRAIAERFAQARRPATATRTWPSPTASRGPL